MYIFFGYNFRESSFAATLGHKESLQELTLNLVSLTYFCVISALFGLVRIVDITLY